MSLVKANAAQIGQSVTATDNFTMYQPASPDGTVRWGVGNSGSVTDIVTLNSSGYVGVGTSSPASKLHVLGSAQGIARFQSTDAEVNIALNNASATGNLFGAAGANFYWYSGGSERMRLDSSGNLGLGTSSPSYKLDVNKGSNGIVAKFTGTASAYVHAATSEVYFSSDASANNSFAANTGNYLVAYTGGSERMRIDSSGNVHIATSSTYGTNTKLSVYGSTTAGDSGIVLSDGATTTIGLSMATPSIAQTPYIFGNTALAFGSNGGERMRIDSSGRVGIGTYSPSQKFVVSNAGADNIVMCENSSASIQMFMQATSGTGAVGTLTNHPVQFLQNNTERMRIDSSGNVGIGTSSTSYVLQLQKNNTQIWTDCQASYVEQSLSLSSGSNIDWYQSTKGTGAFIWRQNATTERMRIDSSGNLLIGTSNTTFGSVGIQNFPSGYMQIARDNNPVLYLKRGSAPGNIVQFYAENGSNTGWIYISTSGVTYNSSSDYRLKEDVAPMLGALDRVEALKPCTYKWKYDKADGEGFIAHELQEVIPEAVTGVKDAVDEDGKIIPQGVDYARIVPLLTAAIQEQQAIIESLTQRIEQLEAK